MEGFKLDDRVKVLGKNVKGKIAFIGTIHASDGIMYGIALDKPKGRCNGAVGGIRYFMCPKDHGVFVRACQLEIDRGNSSDDSEDYNDVVPRPAYPNYLKHSSKMNFRKSKYHTKSKEHVLQKISPLKSDVRLKQPSEDKIGHDPEVKAKKSKQSSRKRPTVDEEFRFLAEKINTQTQQLDTIRRYIRKLKTYVKWSRGFDLKEKQMKILIDSAIDNVIRIMEDIIGKSELGNDYEQPKHDSELEQENTLLLHCILDLEKKNETLVECLIKIRALLLKSRKHRSRGKSKSDANRKEVSKERPHPSENKCNNCSEKIPESRSVSPSLTKNQQHSNEILQKEDQGKRETETIKRYLESLNYDVSKKENRGGSSSSLLSKKENRSNDNSQGDGQELRKAVCVRNYLESLNHDIKELNKELNDIRNEKSSNKCDERVSSKSNLKSENTKSPILKGNRSNKSTYIHQTLRPLKGTNRLKPYDLDKRMKMEQNAEASKISDPTEEEEDPTKELLELISSIINNISLDEQSGSAPRDSPKFNEQNVNTPEASLIAIKTHSNPGSDKFEKMSNSSNKSKSEDYLKSSKSIAGANTKRRKLPVKRIQLKRTMAVTKQPTPHRPEKD